MGSINPFLRGHFSDMTRCICLIFHTLNVASLSGRPFCCLATITALRPWLVPCFAYRVPVGTHFLLSCLYHGTAPMACTVFCISRPYRDALSVVLPLSRHCAHGLYRVLHIASLSGRPIDCLAAITAMRLRIVPCYACRVLSGRPFCCLAVITALRSRLVPCFAYRVPVGTPYRLSCCYHGTAPKDCTMLCLSRPFGTHFLLSCRYHGTAPKACTVLCISRPCRDALSVVLPLSRHSAQGLYRVIISLNSPW